MFKGRNIAKRELKGLLKALRYSLISYLLPLTSIIILVGCSTKNNTAKSRWWHSFNAKYNTYYNGQLAFTDGNLEKEKGNQDNYTEILPLYPVGNKNSREIGKV